MKELKRLKGFWKIILILIIIYMVFGGTMFWYYLSGDKTKEAAGQFGDMFGGITALFGTLTFAGVLYTIILQRRELKLTRREMKLSRLAFEEQNTTTKIQRFENTFFKMIESIENARQNFQLISPNGSNITGEKAFDQLLKSTNECFYIGGDKENPVKYTGDIYQLIAHYFKNQKIPASNISVYFARVTNLVELVCTSELTLDQRNFYTRILTTSISNRHELALLYYHFALNDDKQTEQSKEFIRQSPLFGNLVFGDLAHISHAEILFSDESLKMLKKILNFN